MTSHGPPVVPSWPVHGPWPILWKSLHSKMMSHIHCTALMQTHFHIDNLSAHMRLLKQFISVHRHCYTPELHDSSFSLISVFCSHTHALCLSFPLLLFLTNLEPFSYTDPTQLVILSRHTRSFIQE